MTAGVRLTSATDRSIQDVSNVNVRITPGR